MKDQLINICKQLPLIKVKNGDFNSVTCIWIAILITLCFQMPGKADAQQKSTSRKSINFPFEAAYWDTASTKSAFVNFQGIKVLKMKLNTNPVVLKNYKLSNGTIEFDTQPVDVKGFSPIGVYFRRSSEKESEYIYFRTKVDDRKRDNDDIQYVPIIKGALPFNMYSHFDGPADFHNDQWNHVKIVLSGVQMKVYVNNMTETVLDIPRLESNSGNGNIGFDGQAYFANVVIRPGETEGLSPLEGFDPTRHDINYIRSWKRTNARVLPQGKELTVQDLPRDTAKWVSILAERRGMINLTRTYGGCDTNRFVWLKTKIVSSKDQVMQCQLGFCDEVYVFVNEKLIAADKNQFGQPMSKFPNGCLNIDNSMISLPLKKGDNELLIGLINNFYGWGIMARLRSLAGITIL